MRIRNIVSTFAAAGALAGCAGKEKVAPPGFRAAQLVSPGAPRPVKPAGIAAPVPLPGQLVPKPAMRKPRETMSPEARVAAANRDAVREPVSEGYLNAVQVYPWAEGALYRLYTAPEQVSDVALERGETLVSVAAGDTLRWIIGDTVSGSGAQRRTHVLVKPAAAGLRTNLIITTDRRSYHLLVESNAGTAMAAVSWIYPKDQLMALERMPAFGTGSGVAGPSQKAPRFRYVISGDRPPWRPLRAYDDGRQVFIEFPAAMARGEAPPLFVLGADGEAELVNYRIRGNLYIVDQLFAAAELRLGKAPQQVVRIRRSGGQRRIGRQRQS